MGQEQKLAPKSATRLIASVFLAILLVFVIEAVITYKPAPKALDYVPATGPWRTSSEPK